PARCREGGDMVGAGRPEHLRAYLTLVITEPLSFFRRSHGVMDLHVGVVCLLFHQPALLSMELDFEAESTLVVKPPSVDSLVLVIAPLILYHPKLEVAFF